MGNIQNVIVRSHGSDNIYTFTLTAEELLGIARVDRFEESKREGVNRALDQNHAMEIAEAMLDPELPWLEPILGDLRGQSWTHDEGKRRLEFGDGAYISIDDGQHRLAALALLEPKEVEKLTFTVTVTHGLPLKRRLRIFRMQAKRKKLDPRLDLAQRHRLGDWRSPLDGEAYRLVLALNTEDGSPLKGMIQVTEVAKEGGGETINAKTLHTALRRAIGSQSPLNELEPAEREDAVRNLVTAASEVWTKAWGSPEHVITASRGMSALFSLVVNGPNFRGAMGDDFSLKKLRDALGRAKSFDWSVEKLRGEKTPETVKRLDAAIHRGRAQSKAKGNHVEEARV